MVNLHVTVVKNHHHIPNQTLCNSHSFHVTLVILHVTLVIFVVTLAVTLVIYDQCYRQCYSLDRHGPCNWPMCCSMPILRRMLAFFSKGHL